MVILILVNGYFKECNLASSLFFNFKSEFTLEVYLNWVKSIAYCVTIVYFIYILSVVAFYIKRGTCFITWSPKYLTENQKTLTTVYNELLVKTTLPIDLIKIIQEYINNELFIKTLNIKEEIINIESRENHLESIYTTE